MKFAFEPQTSWCGTDVSYAYVLECSARAAEVASLDFEPPTMWDKVGSVAVVNIQGPLIQGDAGFMRHFGITGYDNIREAVAAAVADEEVKSIMLNIDSGGGQVAGVSDTAKFLLAAGKIKPMTTFSDGQMASAAYWLGSTGANLTVTDTTEAGSIGVLIVHVERSQQLAQDGMTATVVRAGAYKASTNSLEPLSAIGKESLTSQVQHLYVPFLAHAADMRGMTAEQADATIAQGRVFVGSQGVDVGLVDNVGTYEEALARATMPSGKPKSAKMSVSISLHGTTAENVTYNPAQMTKGLEMKPTLHIPTTADLGVTAVSASLEDAAVLLAAQEAAAALEEAAAAQAVAALAATAKAVAAEDNKVIAFLRNELKESQAALVAAEQATTVAQAEASGMKESYDKFETIARLSVDVMAVSLGGSSSTGLSGGALLAEHARLEPTYLKKFKAGGVAAVTPGVEGKSKDKPSYHPMFAVLAQSVPASK